MHARAHTAGAAVGRPMSFHSLRARTNAGEEISLDKYAGKVVLAVNVARL